MTKEKDILEIYTDYIDNEGYVLRYDYENKTYYNTGTCLRGPKGNPGNPGRPGKNGDSWDLREVDGTYYWFKNGANTGISAQTAGDVSGKEDKSNKVTSWQITPDDTHYPSEKLVKDSIDRVKGGSTKSIADLSEDIAAETERATTIEAGLRESIDELGQIGLDPDNAISTNSDDFEGDTTAKRSKIPTIGAIIDGNPGVYDVSKGHPTDGPNSDGKFTLEYVLANANTLIPTSRRHGGMEICFVLSSDNKYVQYRLMSDTFNTTPANWQGVDDEPTAGSENLVESDGVYNEIVSSIQDYRFRMGAYFSLSNLSVGSTIAVDTTRINSTNSSYGYCCVEVNKGDIAYIKNMSVTSSTKSYAVIDSDGEVLSLEDNAVSTKIVVPDTAKWLIVNTGGSAVGCYVKVVKKDVINSLEKVVTANNNLLTKGDFRAGSAIGASNIQITTKVIPLNGASKVVIYTNRPNRTGCSYRYGICLSDSLQDAGSLAYQNNLVGPTSRMDVSATSINSLINVWNSTAKCANISIAEYDDVNNEFKTLSVDDFVLYGYCINILANSQIEAIVNERIKDKVKSKSDVLTAEGVISLMQYTNASINGTLTGSYYNLGSAAVGQSYTPTTVSAPGYTGVIVDVSEDDVFVLNTNSNTSSAKAYAILDSNNVVLELSQTAVNKLLVIPANAAKLIVNTKVVAGQDFLVKIGAKADAIAPVDSVTQATLDRSITSQALLNMLASAKKAYFTDAIKNRYVNMSSAVKGEAYTFATSGGNGYTYEDLAVNGGEVFIGKCLGTTSSSKAYMILDQNSKVLDVQLNWNGTYITMPSGAKRLLVNTFTNSSSYYLYKIVGIFDDIPAIEDKVDALFPYNITLDNKDSYLYWGGASVGAAISPYIISSAGFTYLYIRVFSGEKYHIRTTGNTSDAKSYALMDKNHAVVAFKQAAGSYDITVEQDGWLAINTKYNDYSIIQYNWQIRVQKSALDYIYSSIYDIARFNNDFKFDYAQIDQLYAGTIRLGYERSLPRKGSAINTDVELNYSVTDESTEAQIAKRCVPYLYWNQKKIGTIVLFDETTGKPYLYDKSGNKVILATENI